MLNNPNEWHNIESEEELVTEAAQDVDEAASVAEEESVPASNFSLDFSNKNVRLALAGVLLIVLLLVATVAKHFKNNGNQAVPQNQEQLGDYFYDQAGGNPNQTAVVEVPADPMAPPANGVNVPPDGTIGGQPNMPNQPAGSDAVLIGVGGGGRENPFLPLREPAHSIATIYPTVGNSVSRGPSGYYGKVGFELIEPPTSYQVDQRAEDLMETTISGIMYDTRNPSAIVNINGEDQLVRKGDRLFGYSIMDITKDRVVIKSGSNIYRAAVGQSIATQGVNIRQVANLQHKFGGAYTSRPVKSLQFNAN